MKKQKKFGRKLQLNKETIESLNQLDTKEVVGGRTADCVPTVQGLPCPCLKPITIPDTFLC